MKVGADVEGWFATKKPRAEGPMRRVREIILSADPRLTEYMKYGSVHFGYEGDFVTFVQADKKNVNLMFHRGATKLRRARTSCARWPSPGACSWLRPPRK